MQRSSSINDRYLLVEELPQNFECYDRSFEFLSNESRTSVILPDQHINFTEFDALPLQQTLTNTLENTGGCFVCFGGNTLLIGKTKNGFFSFDSYSRTIEGMFTTNGKSTRVLFDTIDQLFLHLTGLALSMGYSSNVECNLTGVHCKMTNILNIPEDKGNDNGTQNLTNNNDLVFVCETHEQYRFLLLNNKEKTTLCKSLNVPLLHNSDNQLSQCHGQDLGEPICHKEISRDGNCYFRAISYALTNTEDFHNIMRNAVCAHILDNKELFKKILRNDQQSVENYIASSSMSQNGVWATEVEILAMAHLLKVDIYTFSEGHWLRYSGQIVNTVLQKNKIIWIMLAKIITMWF